MRKIAFGNLNFVLLLTLSLTSCLPKEPVKISELKNPPSNSIDQPLPPGTSQEHLNLTEMQYSRADHAAVKMQDGKVFVFGGIDDPAYEAKTEIYDPSDDSWSTGPDLAVGSRRNGKGLLLNDGRILIMGGFKAEIEVYDSLNNTISLLSTFSHSRAGASFNLLPTGDVLITGGVDENQYYYNDAEIFNPTTNSLRSTFNNFAVARANHTVEVLSNGGALIIGGTKDGYTVSNVEYYNPSSEGFYSTNSLREPRMSHYSFLLSNDIVLVAGGATIVNGYVQCLDSVEKSAAGAFDFLNYKLPFSVYEGASAQLLNGAPVIVGGDNITNGYGQNSIYLYDFNSEKFELAGALSVARKKHTLTILDDGSLLVIGGSNGNGPINSAERFSILGH